MAPTIHIAQELLSRSHPPDSAAVIFTDKVLRKPLHLRPTSPDPTSQDARAQRRSQRLRKTEKIKKRRKVKPLSAKEKRILGIYDVPLDAQKYELYVPLHRMWLGYMHEVLGIVEGKSNYVTAQSKGSILCSADYHGAEMAVVRARCPSLVGLQGIVIKDTTFTFQLITQKNEMKIVPKRHAVFRFEVSQTLGRGEAEQKSAQTTEHPTTKSADPLVFELHGSQFQVRPTDRATKRFKQKHLKDI